MIMYITANYVELAPLRGLFFKYEDNPPRSSRIIQEGVDTVQIKPSASIRQNYNEIAALCKASGEPVYLTKNGKGDLVVMDIEAFVRREKMLRLREELLAVEEDRLAGRTGITPDELDNFQAVLLMRWNMEETPQFRVNVSGFSRQMLASHLHFLVQKSLGAARRTQNEIVAAIRSLATMPQQLPFLNMEFIPPNKYHKMVIRKRYLILYQIKNETVYVDYIMDCRQDYGWLIR